jgi:large repetitive protein
VGLGPFVETEPVAGRVDTAVRILGNGLVNASSLTFNGTPAAFVIKSSNSITATVPTGAATGPVQVVTPSGTLTSNVNFQVEP